MTKKDDKSKSSEEDGGNKEVADKLKTMGVMPSDDPADAKPDDVNKGSYYPLIMAVMFAAVIGGIVYFFSGKDLNMDLTDLSSELGVPDFFASDASHQNSPTSATPTMPPQQPAFNTSNPSTEPDWMAARREAMKNRTDAFQASRNNQKWTPPETPEWVQEQRNKMKEQMAERAASNGSSNQDWTPPEPPAWAKEQQALRQKRLAQRPDWTNTSRSTVEPPAWVKERQAMLEKQRPQRPDWANHGPDTASQLPAWVKERQSQMMGQRPDWARPPQWQQPATTTAPQALQPQGPVYYPPVPAYGYYGPAPYPYYGPRY